MDKSLRTKPTFSHPSRVRRLLEKQWPCCGSKELGLGCGQKLSWIGMTTCLAPPFTEVQGESAGLIGGLSHLLRAPPSPWLLSRAAEHSENQLNALYPWAPSFCILGCCSSPTFSFKASSRASAFQPQSYLQASTFNWGSSQPTVSTHAHGPVSSPDYSTDHTPNHHHWVERLPFTWTVTTQRPLTI